MNADRLDRAGAFGGIGFTVLAFASTFVVSPPPAVDDAVGKIRDYLTGHDAGLAASVVLYAAAMLAFALFVTMVHRRIATAAPGSPAAGAWLVAGTACTTLGLLGAVFQGALVQRIAPVADDSTLLAWYSVWDMVAFTGPPLAITAAYAAVVAVNIRYEIFPQWTTWIAAASAVLGGIAAVADLTSSGGVPAPVDFGGFLIANVWQVAISVIVLRAGAASATPRRGAGVEPSAARVS